MDENISLEEKIDFIYRTLRAQKRRDFLSRISKRIFRLLIIAYLVYFYFFGWKIMINMLTSMSNNMIGPEMTTALKEEFVNGFKAGIKGASGSESGTVSEIGTGTQQSIIQNGGPQEIKNIKTGQEKGSESGTGTKPKVDINALMNAAIKIYQQRQAKGN